MIKKEYDFDQIIDRTGTDCEKYDHRSAIFGRPDVIPMWVADMDFATPDFVVEAMHRRLEHPLYGYTYRSDSYYASASRWLERRAGWRVESLWMGFSAGVVAGLTFAMRAVTEAGDRVVIQPPVYAPFARMVNSNHRTLVTNPLIDTGHGFEIDFDDLDRKLDGAKAFILCNPQNPTGRVFTEAELLRIGDLCLKHGVTILSDEIHSDLIIRPHRHIHIASLLAALADITITFVAPSKTFNVAGLSTSISVIPNDRLRELYNTEAAMFHVDNGNIFGAVALEAAYTHGDRWLDELNEYMSSNFDYIIDFLATNIPQIRCHKSEATYMLWLDCRSLGLTQSELESLFVNDAGLGLNTGTWFGPEGEGYMRMNAAMPRSVIEQAMRQLAAAVNRR